MLIFSSSGSRQHLKETRNDMVYYLCINTTVTIEPEGLFKMGKEGYSRLWLLEEGRTKCELDLAISVTLKAIRFTANMHGIP